jgi:hypothetical protein
MPSKEWQLENQSTEIQWNGQSEIQNLGDNNGRRVAGGPISRSPVSALLGARAAVQPTTTGTSSMMTLRRNKR